MLSQCNEKMAQNKLKTNKYVDISEISSKKIYQKP